MERSRYQVDAARYYARASRDENIADDWGRFKKRLEAGEGISKSIGHLTRAIEAVGARNAVKALDFGCGNGALVDYLSGVEGCDAVGVDRDRALIEAARAENSMLASRLCVADVLAGPLPFAGGTFDLIHCHAVIQHFDGPELRRAMSVLRYLLRGGGRIVLTFKSERLLSESRAAARDGYGRLLNVFPAPAVIEAAAMQRLRVPHGANISHYATTHGFVHTTVDLERRDQG